jgi:secreted protein with Ig-like and vWFA domain
MNERLTAYALNELPPHERELLEAELHSDPVLAAEATDMKGFCEMLNEHIAHPGSDSLTAEQRLALIKSFGASTAGPKNILRPFWRHPVFISTTAVAACVTFLMVKHYDVDVSNRELMDETGRPMELVLSEAPKPILKEARPDVLAKNQPTAKRVSNSSSNSTISLPDLGQEEQRKDAAVAKASEPGSKMKIAAPTAEGKSLQALVPPASAPLLAKTEAAKVETKTTFGKGEAALSPIPTRAAGSAVSLSGRTESRAEVLKPDNSKSDRGRTGYIDIEAVLDATPAPSSLYHTTPNANTITIADAIAPSPRPVADEPQQDRFKLSVTGKLEPTPDTSLAPSPSGTATYRPIIENPFTYVAQAPLSTFSTDVDSASYANVRRFLNHGQRPPADAVRLEELINYFPYSRYEPPSGDKPFSVQVDLAEAPWQPLHRLARIALKGREIHEERQAANFVFLLDVSGSMSPAERLPLIKQSLRLLVDQLREDDHVSIVTYAGQSGVALPSTSGAEKLKIMAVIDDLHTGGSTNGVSGINLAYEQALLNFKKGGINRVILCTDGDFNVGTSNVQELEKLIAEKAKSGVFLSLLGVGTNNLHDHTMQTLADRGNGNYNYLDSLSEARKVLVDQMGGTLITIAKDVKIQVEFNPSQVAAYRLIGYEKWMLAKQDFNDDKKDAGEIGAGHTITALYEIVPASLKYPDGKPLVDDLKYQSNKATVTETPSQNEAQSKIQNPKSKIELMTVKLRYKAPDGDKSQLIETPVVDAGKKLAESPKDFQFAVSVAGFGMMLRDSQQRGELTWDLVRQLALKGKGEDPQGYRGEFLQLLDKARGLCEGGR